MSINELICGSCGVLKSVINYYLDPRYRYGYRPICKECYHEKSKTWKGNNPDKLKTYDRKYKDKMRGTPEQKERTRRSSLKGLYGVTPEWVDDKIIKQGFSCAICRVLFEDQKDTNVDHSHVTGKVRGILCRRCNHSVERVEKIVDWGLKAQRYLDKYKKV